LVVASGTISKSGHGEIVGTYVVERVWISTDVILHEKAAYVAVDEVVITVRGERDRLIGGHSGEQSKH
jgi:hypothetical protein